MAWRVLCQIEATAARVVVGQHDSFHTTGEFGHMLGWANQQPTFALVSSAFVYASVRNLTD
jgi:hypothetical protein